MTLSYLRWPSGLTALGLALMASLAVSESASPRSREAQAAKPVKVFILAGQSNMQGHGFVKADPRRNGGMGSLEHVARDPATAARYRHLLDDQGQWLVRDDVWIHYLDRKGRLTVGYGVDSDRIGPELGFGQVMGDALEEPVLLIKLAWGGKSLAVDFRPPSAGGEVGPFYREVVERTQAVLKNLKQEFPEFGERGFEIAGFGWHQGWNDRINQAFNDEHEQNMENFSRDICKDLGVAQLPFINAETGMAGPQESHPRALSLMKAQAAVAQHEEFQGNVAFVGTRDFWREPQESPSNQSYHWNLNAETYYLIGEAMGKAMLELCSTPKVAQQAPQAGEMAGYLLVPHSRVDQSFNGGFSMYVAAWPLLKDYPGNRFQTGLFGQRSRCWQRERLE
ncbi:MAG TPA: sialate O-acetylesterase [Gemmatales bacterium]|nr:sialate O-acetylesterase [Gemmatales bacterium]